MNHPAASRWPGRATAGWEKSSAALLGPHWGACADIDGSTGRYFVILEVCSPYLISAWLGARLFCEIPAEHQCLLFIIPAPLSASRSSFTVTAASPQIFCQIMKIMISIKLRRCTLMTLQAVGVNHQGALAGIYRLLAREFWKLIQSLSVVEHVAI